LRPFYLLILDRIQIYLCFLSLSHIPVARPRQVHIVVKMGDDLHQLPEILVRSSCRKNAAVKQLG
jgi:hypothetical protein